MKRVLLASVGILLSLSASFSHAENLIDVFKLAITNDAKLLVAQSDREAELESNPQAVALWMPTISAQGSFGQFTQDLNSAYISEAEQDLLTSYVFKRQNVSLNLTQPVFRLPNFYELKIADAKTVQAEIHYREAQQDLILRVAENYFSVLSKMGDLDFARAEKNAIANQLRQTKQRFEVGLIAVTDVHEAQARHDLAVAAEVVAENILANAREQLREITGKVHQQLSPLKEQAPLTPPSPTNINDWTEASRNQNLKLAAKRWDVDIAAHQIKQIRAERFPTVDLNAYYGYFQDGSLFGLEYTELGATIDFKMMLYQGGAISSRIRRAENNAVSNKDQLSMLENQVVTETRHAYLGVLAGMSFVKALRQALSSSNAALRATEAGFEVGTRSAIEVLDAQRELFRAQRDYAHARYDYIINMMRLKKSVGLLTIDDLELANGWLR